MSLLLLFQSSLAGPVNVDFNVVEADDTLAASVTLDLIGNLAVTEAEDVATAAGAATIAASAAITEGDDTLNASATLAIVANLAVTVGDDVLSAAGTLEVVATVVVVEDDDNITTSTNLIVSAFLAITEEDDTLDMSALMPIWYERRGGDDAWGRYEQRQIEWQEQLRRIIDQSWLIANGEIDPVTFEPNPPPDYDAVIDELVRQAEGLDRDRIQAFVAEQERLKEEQAIAVLLLAA